MKFIYEDQAKFIYDQIFQELQETRWGIIKKIKYIVFTNDEYQQLRTLSQPNFEIREGLYIWEERYILIENYKIPFIVKDK